MKLRDITFKTIPVCVDNDQDPAFNGNFKRIYAHILHKQGQNDCTWASLETMADELGLSSRTAARAVKFLAKIGLVSIDEQYIPGNRGRRIYAPLDNVLTVYGQDGIRLVNGPSHRLDYEVKSSNDEFVVWCGPEDKLPESADLDKEPRQNTPDKISEVPLTKCTTNNNQLTKTINAKANVILPFPEEGNQNQPKETQRLYLERSPSLMKVRSDQQEKNYSSDIDEFKNLLNAAADDDDEIDDKAGNNKNNSHPVSQKKHDNKTQNPVDSSSPSREGSLNIKCKNNTSKYKSHTSKSHTVDNIKESSSLPGGTPNFYPVGHNNKLSLEEKVLHGMIQETEYRVNMPGLYNHYLQNKNTFDSLGNNQKKLSAVYDSYKKGLSTSRQNLLDIR